MCVIVLIERVLVRMWPEIKIDPNQWVITISKKASQNLTNGISGHERSFIC